MKLDRSSVLGPLGAAVLAAAAAPAGAATLFPAAFADLPPSISPAAGNSILNAPDDQFIGLGSEHVTYDLQTYRLVDGVGQDFNVYEVDSGIAEFGAVNILVSADNINFFNVEATSAAALNLDGDEAHGNAGFRRSYNVAGAVAALGVGAFRYIRIDGTGSGQAGGSAGFDLDAIGIGNFINLAPPGVPEPTAWTMMLLGFGGVGGLLRRRRARRPARVQVGEFGDRLSRPFRTS